MAKGLPYFSTQLEDTKKVVPQARIETLPYYMWTNSI